MQDGRSLSLLASQDFNLECTASWIFVVVTVCVYAINSAWHSRNLEDGINQKRLVSSESEQRKAVTELDNVTTLLDCALRSSTVEYEGGGSAINRAC